MKPKLYPTLYHIQQKSLRWNFFCFTPQSWLTKYLNVFAEVSSFLQLFYLKRKCMVQMANKIAIWLIIGAMVTHFSTAENTVITPDFLVLKFCGKAQFPHSFGRFAPNYVETVPFHKISRPRNQVKLRYFSQCSLLHLYTDFSKMTCEFNVLLKNEKLEY